MVQILALSINVDGDSERRHYGRREDGLVRAYVSLGETVYQYCRRYRRDRRLGEFPNEFFHALRRVGINFVELRPSVRIRGIVRIEYRYFLYEGRRLSDEFSCVRRPISGCRGLDLLSEYGESRFDVVEVSSVVRIRIASSRIRAIDDRFHPGSPYLAHHEVRPGSDIRGGIIDQAGFAELPLHSLCQTECRYVRTLLRSDEAVRYHSRRLRDDDRLVDAGRRCVEQFDLGHDDDVSSAIDRQAVRAMQMVRQVPVVGIRVIRQGSGEHPLARYVRASEVLKRVPRYSIDEIAVMEGPVRYEVRV